VVTEGDGSRDGQEVLGRRIGAALLDLIPIGVLFFLVALLTGNVDTDNGVYAHLNGVPALLWFALAIGYYAVLESATGQTLGKRILGVKVIQPDGENPSPGKSAGRNLLRVIDILPFLYLLGFIVVLATGKKAQRIGDLAASTHVVAAD
jgi:uncharacterized RDD family membrane protein YckC